MKKIKLPEFVKIASNDPVDMIVLTIFLVVVILDLFTDVIPKGGYGLFFAYAVGCVLRLGWWKMQYKHKGEPGWKDINPDGSTD